MISCQQALQNHYHFNMTVLIPLVIPCTHHQGCVRAIPLICKVSGRSGTRGTAAEAAVWPHPVQCRHLDLHPSQGELLQVTQPKKKGLVSLHAVWYIRLIHNRSFQPQKVSVILCIIEPSVELMLLVLTCAYFLKEMLHVVKIASHWCDVRFAMAASVCAGADKIKLVKHTHQI